MSSGRTTIKIFNTADEAAREGAVALIELAEWSADKANPQASVALSGGSTPAAMYHHLCFQSQQHAESLRTLNYFFGDERSVGNFHPDSNVRLAMDRLLTGVRVPLYRIYAPDGGAEDLDAEAARMTDVIRSVMPLNESGVPVFDLIFLGMGDDGHTASLFPGQPTLNERARWCIPAEPKHDPYVPRMTLTFAALESCRASAFLLSGAGKKIMLQKVLAGEDLPAAKLKPQGRLTWFTDQAAAGL